MKNLAIIGKKGNAMKLRKLLVAALLLALLLQMPALATEKEGKVSVKLPSFAVTLNGTAD